MIPLSFAAVSRGLMLASFCALAVVSRDAVASPAPPAARTPAPDVTSKPGRPRGGLLLTIVPWPEATFSQGQRIRLKLLVSNVSDVAIRTNLVYQPLSADVRVSVVNEADPQRPLAQEPHPVMDSLGPPPATIPPGGMRTYEIPLDKYTPQITKPGGYVVEVRVRVGTENGAAVWLVSNEVMVYVN